MSVTKLKTKNKSLTKHIKDIKRKEYSVKIIFVMLNNAKQCIERIKHSVIKGGHHVPDEDVIRRYDRGLKIFWNLYKGLVDEWRLYNNSETGYEFVAGGNASKFEIAHEKLFNDFLGKLNL